MLTIAHLYHDLLNLYGESGNVKALEYNLNNIGIKTKVVSLSLDDDFSFKDYDIVYIGTGTENNQLLALNHLLAYKQDIKDYIENKKYFFVTGNSIELFGKSINMNEALNIFDYTAKTSAKRLVDESLYTTKLIKKSLLGVQNRTTYLENVNCNLFERTKKIESNIDSTYEGFTYNNFYGTYLLGPLLIKNPALLSYFITDIIASYNLKPKQKLNLNLEQSAYENYLKTHN